MPSVRAPCANWRALAGAALTLLLLCTAACSSARVEPHAASGARTGIAATGQRPAETAIASAARPRSEAELQEALARDLHDASAYEELARLYLARGERQPGARLLARQVVEQGLTTLAGRGLQSADLLTTRAQLALDAGHLRVARSDLEAALQLDPGSPRALWLLGVLGLEVRDFDGARAVLTRLSRDPAGADSPDVWIALGVAERGAMHYTAAESAYQKAARLDPSDPRPWFNLGLLYRYPVEAMTYKIEEERRRLARAHLQRFNELARDDPRFTRETLVASDMLAIIDASGEICVLRRPDLDEKAAEMVRLYREQEAEERKRLLELERQALEAESPGSSPE